MDIAHLITNEAAHLLRHSQLRARNYLADVFVYLLALFRGVFQYGDLHFGHTRGSSAALRCWSHSCEHRSQMNSQTLISFLATIKSL